MGKTLKKYFIAIVPEGAIQDAVTEIKYRLKEEFGLKYALKSPPHITMKMPFLYNENKETRLFHLIEEFFSVERKMALGLSGFRSFRQRVIYIRVKYPPELMEMQQRLASFCKSRMNVPVELSDLNYQPHMTVAFQDLKKDKFSEYMDFLNAIRVRYDFTVENVGLLKKEDYKWDLYKRFPLGGDFTSKASQ
ncbi:2'-5' RNA ligase family protein [Negadavirga shengliensis]|uniref:2'-5' RNA ligase family protein n=1 Tax=Negadavirga shengliensis TaxID=1389218 RepID=A0ABV9SXH1_9BACT